MNKILCLFLILTFTLSKAFAQFKYEKESRVKEAQVPKPAVQFIQKVDFDKKIKWYKEQGLDKISFEAKTKRQGAKYSIEFDSIGTIEDIEVDIKWKEVPIQVQQKMETYFSSNHEKYKRCKIQRQFVGETDQLLRSLSNTNQVGEVIVNYEIVIKAKTKGEHEKLEYLFSSQGEMLRRDRIVLKNIDNLEY